MPITIPAPLDLRLPQLARQLRRGDLPLADYLRALAAQFDRCEAEVLAFVPESDRFARLHDDAQRLLAKYPDPATRPPLFGVPLAVKDIFHVAGFATRAGSHVPPEVLSGSESKAVTALKAAGVLLLGKAHTTEFAYFGPAPTRNPHNTAHTPGGSSSGSAAAVAAGLAPLAFGTQTIGSVVRPASFCGVAGFKPSQGRVSKAGVIPLSRTFDHVGWFAGDVTGLRAVAPLLVAGWQAIAPPAQPTLGVPAGPYMAHADPAMLSHFEARVNALLAAGYAVKQVAVMPDFDAIATRHRGLTAYDAAQAHRGWYPAYGDRYHAKTRALIEQGLTVADDEAAAIKHAVAASTQQVTAVMDSAGIDAFITPAAPGAAPAGLDSTGDPIMNLPWTQFGFPALNLPAGVNDAGLPLGLQLVARHNHDEALLAWAEPMQHLVR